MIVLYSRSAIYMYNDGKKTKNTRHIARRIRFVRKGKVKDEQDLFV